MDKSDDKNEDGDEDLEEDDDDDADAKKEPDGNKLVPVKTRKKNVTGKLLLEGDWILFDYGRCVLEGCVTGLQKHGLVVKVQRTISSSVKYPWSLKSEPTAAQRSSYSQKDDVRISKGSVLILLPYDCDDSIYVVRRNFPLNVSCSVFQSHYHSVLKGFKDHFLRLGDQIEIMLQGATLRDEHLNDDFIIKDQKKAEQEYHEDEVCPYETVMATVTMQTVDHVRIHYHLESTKQREKEKEKEQEKRKENSTQKTEEMIPRWSLRCWRRIKSGVKRSLNPSLDASSPLHFKPSSESLLK